MRGIVFNAPGDVGLDGQRLAAVGPFSLHGRQRCGAQEDDREESV